MIRSIATPLCLPFSDLSPDLSRRHDGPAPSAAPFCAATDATDTAFCALQQLGPGRRHWYRADILYFSPSPFVLCRELTSTPFPLACLSPTKYPQRASADVLQTILRAVAAAASSASPSPSPPPGGSAIAAAAGGAGKPRKPLVRVAICGTDATMHNFAAGYHGLFCPCPFAHKSCQLPGLLAAAERSHDRRGPAVLLPTGT
jgi:hypothetical protein